MLVGRKQCIQVEKTHLLRNGKYHCIDRLQFDRFGFNLARKSVDSFNMEFFS